VDKDFLRQQYIEEFSTPEDPLLAKINRETHLYVLHPRMISGAVQGKFLEFISRMIRPGYILEIGTYTGYSAICLAKGLNENGKLITIERNEEIIRFPQAYFKEAGLDSKIEIRTGDALKIIPSLTHTFDLVFIDGDKTEYGDYYKLIIDKVSKGGYLLADNVLWSGKVYNKVEQNDIDTQSIISFNEMVLKDPRVENIILPLRDGISIIRKL
jgi:caffeoyl-CoA O-methyltransferase